MLLEESALDLKTLIRKRIDPAAFSDRPQLFPQNRIHPSGSPAAFYRPTWAEIDHKNLKKNCLEITRRLSSVVSLLTVVKANAYGHGLVPVSKTLSQCPVRFLGVTSVEEGLLLKEARIAKPILILGNIYPFRNLEAVVKNELRVTVASIESAKICNQFGKKLGKKVFAHAKIDTGMNRIGVKVQKGLEFVKKILEMPALRLEGVYTHFSDAAENPKFTQKQIALFTKFVSELRAQKIAVPYIHCANSAALLQYPETHFSMVRPGISLYGVDPAAGKSKIHLKPVMTWKSRIVFLKEVPADTPISYAGTYRTKRRSKIATAAFGYADGYRRNLSNKAQVLVRGHRAPVVGRVTMDMTMLDVTELPHVRVGDEVVLVGSQGADAISIQELASWAETSAYEMFCGIAGRVPRVNIY